MANVIKNRVTYKIGNILDATEDIIVQQGNAQSAMGGGLADQLIKKYPELKASFKRWSASFSSPKDRMGKVHIFDRTGDGKLVMTIVGQLYYGRDGKLYTDYDAFTEGLIVVARAMKIGKKTVALPYRIGCGLAGGDWKTIRQIIESQHTTTPDFTSVYALGMEDIEEYDYKRFGIA